MDTQKKLSKVTLIAYGCGDFASNLCWTFIGSYLSVFYTDVVGMAPAAASAIMLIAKIWDGVNDPMFGAIAERTNTSKGRFRPYIFYGAPVLAVLSVLAFTTFGSGTTAVIYAAVTYIACGMAYTVVNLSYGSLSTVMTTDPEDIAQLNSFRMMGTNLSAVLLNAITPVLLVKFSGGEQYTAGAYTKCAIIFAICSLPLFYFLYANCKEVIRPAVSATKVPVSTSIKNVLSNGPLMLIFAIQLLAMTAFFGRMGVVIYYLIYNVQRFDLISAFMSLPSVFTIIGIMATKNSMGLHRSRCIPGRRVPGRMDQYPGPHCAALPVRFLLLLIPDPDGDGPGCDQLPAGQDRRPFRRHLLCNCFPFHQVRVCIRRIRSTDHHGRNGICGERTADSTGDGRHQSHCQPDLRPYVSPVPDPAVLLSS